MTVLPNGWWKYLPSRLALLVQFLPVQFLPEQKLHEQFLNPPVHLAAAGWGSRLNIAEASSLKQSTCSTYPSIMYACPP